MYGPEELKNQRVKKEQTSLIVPGLIDFDVSATKLFLDQTFSNGQPNRRQMREAVDLLGQRSILSSIIVDILTTPELFTESASQSYFHDETGMERIMLASKKGLYDLRLHIWWPGKKVSREDAHTHPYNFASKALIGPILHDLFSPRDNGLVMNAYSSPTYSARKNDPTLEIVHVGLAHLQPLSQTNVREGQIYTMSHRAIHSIPNEEPNQVIASLNLRGPTVVQQPTFYRTVGVDKPAPAKTPLDVETSLKRFLAIYDPRGFKRVPRFLS